MNRPLPPPPGKERVPMNIQSITAFLLLSHGIGFLLSALFRRHADFNPFIALAIGLPVATLLLTLCWLMKELTGWTF